MSYLKNPGLTKGIVVDTEDPAGFNRVKVRIVELHGAVSEDVYQYCRDYNNLRWKMWLTTDPEAIYLRRKRLNKNAAKQRFLLSISDEHHIHILELFLVTHLLFEFQLVMLFFSL